MWNCTLCPKKFNFQNELNHHAASHTKEKPHKCPTCPVAYGYLYSLKAHKNSVHEGVKRIRLIRRKLKCPMCSYEAIDITRLRDHTRIHSADKPFSCKVPGCSFKTKHQRSIPDHVRSVHSNERLYECQSDGCKYKAKYLNRLKKHLKTHSKERPFLCTYSGCNKAFKTQRTFKFHVDVVHKDERSLKCSTCEFTTKYKHYLQMHEDDHRNIKRFHCQAPNCSYATNRTNLIQRHLDLKHNKKNMSCSFQGCFYKCGSTTLLKKHQKNHMLPILKCPENSCNFSARDKQAIRQHLSYSHSDAQSVLLVKLGRSTLLTGGKSAEQNQLVCPFPNCHYQTEFRHRYDHHLKTHEEEKRKHTCFFCHSIFEDLSVLERHIRTHTEEKPYSCSHCNFTTAASSNLRSHAGTIHSIYLVRRREPRIVVKCQLCKTICWSKGELVLHSMKHLQPVVVLNRLRVNIN